MTRCKMVDLERNRNLSSRDTEDRVNAALEDIQSSGSRILSATVLDNKSDHTLMILFEDGDGVDALADIGMGGKAE